MRKIITTAVLAVATTAAGLAGIATTAHADAKPAIVSVKQDATYVVVPGGAPVRSGPGKSYPVVGWVDEGTAVAGTVVGNWIDMGNDNWVWLGKLA